MDLHDCQATSVVTETTQTGLMVNGFAALFVCCIMHSVFVCVSFGHCGSEWLFVVCVCTSSDFLEIIVGEAIATEDQLQVALGCATDVSVGIALSQWGRLSQSRCANTVGR